jgi:hypothetical protein
LPPISFERAFAEAAAAVERGTLVAVVVGLAGWWFGLA